MIDGGTGFTVIYLFIVVIGACLILALSKAAKNGH